MAKKKDLEARVAQLEQELRDKEDDLTVMGDRFKAADNLARDRWGTITVLESNLSRSQKDLSRLEGQIRQAQRALSNSGVAMPIRECCDNPHKCVCCRDCSCNPCRCNTPPNEKLCNLVDELRDKLAEAEKQLKIKDSVLDLRADTISSNKEEIARLKNESKTWKDLYFRVKPVSKPYYGYKSACMWCGYYYCCCY